MYIYRKFIIIFLKIPKESQRILRFLKGKVVLHPIIIIQPFPQPLQLKVIKAATSIVFFLGISI